jgi:hypothetical protein
MASHSACRCAHARSRHHVRRSCHQCESTQGKFFEAHRNPFGHKSYPGSNKANIGLPSAKTHHLLNECAFPNAHKWRREREINMELNQRIDPGLRPYAQPDRTRKTSQTCPKALTSNKTLNWCPYLELNLPPIWRTPARNLSARDRPFCLHLRVGS